MAEATEDKPLSRLLSLPQELKNRILDHAFPAREFVVWYVPRMWRSQEAKLELRDDSNYQILVVHKTLTEAAKLTIEKAPTTLTFRPKGCADHITYDSPAPSMFTNNDRFANIRENITTVTFDRAEVKGARTSMIRYTTLHSVFDKKWDDVDAREQVEYRRLSGFKDGTNDAAMIYPVYQLNLYTAARELENAGSKATLYLESIFQWKARGHRGIWCFTKTTYKITSSEAIVVSRDRLAGLDF